MPKVTQIEIGGSSLTYTERGVGEPVILVHGALGDYRTWAAQLTPTLVITGASSPRLYQRISSELHGSLPDADLLVLPGITHALKLDESTELSDAVLDFLSEVG